MSAPSIPAPHPGGRDLARAPILGSVLRWRHLRTALQSALLVVAVLVVFDGFTGSPIAPQNLAGVVPWVAWRGLTVLSLLAAGSLFCAACPFVLVRRISKTILNPQRVWPAPLRGKWLAAVLLAAYFWFYEAFDPWASPSITATLVLAFFAGALIVDGVFRGAAFCKHLCPIGQFSFIGSMCSPLEVRARALDVCRTCRTKDCVVGRKEGKEGRVAGCELFLLQERKQGNLDCTFCLDCLHACPHENVGVVTRLPIRELSNNARRSGTAVHPERLDLAFLRLVVIFAAFINAFGMVTPFYEFEKSLILLLGGAPEWMILGVVFLLGLVGLPALLVGAAAGTTRSLVRPKEDLRTIAARFSSSLVPVGLGMWAAHYGFHFLAGGLTVIPAAQNLFADLGMTWAGEPLWDLGPIVPESWLLPVELVLLEAGLLWSLLAAHRVAQAHYGEHLTALRAFLPWAALALLLFVAGVWLILQPMEMRGMQAMVSVPRPLWQTVPL